MLSDKLKRGLVYVLIVIVGIISALGLYFYKFFHQTEQFLPGVAIASVSVGGQDRDKVAADVEAHFNNLYQTPVTFYYHDFRHTATLGELAEPVKINHIINDAWQKEQRRGIRSKLLNLDGSKPIVYTPPIEYKQTVLQKLTEDWNQRLGQPAVDPQLEVDQAAGLIVVPGQDGVEVDMEATWEEMPPQWSSLEPLEIPIIVGKVYPSVSEEDLKVMGELSTYATWYNSSEVNRTYNLVMAAAAINSQVVQPGETFSFNRTVGARTFETGYRDAMVIVDGKFELGVGGGICQVSSTLYNAALLADLEIVERHNHALAVAYIPVGLDATVSYGLQDFQFKNNTSHPLYIRAAAGGGRLTVDLYGHLSNKKRVELSSVIDRVIPFGEIRQEDLTLDPGEERIDQKGFPGYVARSFKLVYDEDGAEVERVQLATDYYQPLYTLIYTGPVLDTPADLADLENGTPDAGEEDLPAPVGETYQAGTVAPSVSGEGYE